MATGLPPDDAPAPALPTEDATEAPPISRARLREATLTGVRWVALGRVLAEVVALGSTVVLARLIPPSAFGLAATAFAITLLPQILAAGGVVSALVQREHTTPQHLAVATFVSTALGAVLTASIWGLAELLRPVVNDEALWLVQLASLSFVLTGLSVAPQATLQRQLDFRRITLIEVLAVLGGTVTTIVLAVLGADGEAIVIGSLATAAVTTVLYVLSVPMAFPRWNRKAAAEVWGVAFPAAVASLSYQGFRNVDYVIVGANLGAAQAGFYWRAFQLGVEYQKKITQVMTRMALPVYSRSQDIAHMRALRERIVRVHATVLVPTLAAFIAIAPELIPFVYGDAWEPAVVPAQVLAGAGMVMALSAGMGPLMLAAGYATVLAWWNLGLLVGYAATVFAAASIGGVVTVCVGVTGFYVAQLLVFHYFLLYRLVGIPMRAVVTDAAPGFVGSAALVAVMVPLVALLQAGGVPAPVTCVLATGFGGAAYLLTVRQLFASAWGDLALLFARVAPKLPTLRRRREATEASR